MTVLVTGGAGYIGSHMVYALLDRGERPVVIDNLSTGIRALLPRDVEMIEGDIGDRALVARVLRDNNVDAVLHFAGSIVVPDSVADPLGYYANNAGQSRILLEACIAAGIANFVFSSSAAVYGAGGDTPIAETAATDPINPYGRSKLMTEWMLEDAARAHDFRYAALRYFNVAGADPQGRTGQSSTRATHLIKAACQTALGRRGELEIFGTDYPTRDGTCVRDYIHVTDLVAAHLIALDALRKGGPPGACNVGYGRGFTVREVIAAVERAAGRAIPVREGLRRAGDPPSLVADPAKLKGAGWQPRLDNLDAIVTHAFAWERRLNR